MYTVVVFVPLNCIEVAYNYDVGILDLFNIWRIMFRTFFLPQPDRMSSLGVTLSVFRDEPIRATGIKLR